ncbi:MAG: NADP-dependent oxidoreductase [Bryobacteraceae bacterium]|nr:NADP-dependent oxidoreductase [Bryobacteraceae bacterium]
MRALRLVRSTPEPLLVEEDLPRPEPGAGEVLVQVHAVAVTPTEVHWYGTSQTRDGGPRVAPVLGHEFSGQIAECGKHVTDFAVGDEVFGMSNWFSEGALAEYCVTTPDLIARKPDALTHAEAATVPISALTAWQGLFDHGMLQPGQRVLIHGGAGAVGLFAVQFAHLHGAYVVTTVSANHIDYARSIGADEALDYRGAPFEERVRDIDVVFDTVGPEVMRRSRRVLKSGGRCVTVAVESKWASDEDVRRAFFIFKQNGAELEQVSNLFEAGQLRAALDRVVPVAAATDAYRGAIAKSRPGKLVISPLEWSRPDISATKMAP